jgi:glycosyltransferase involved in cell wall biosynthesis
MDLSVVIPVYNELENVEELYRRIKTELQKLSLTYEVIFVDDGSTDGTTEKIKKMKESEPQLKLIIFHKNYGQTEAMAAGFQLAKGDIIVTMDGDLQNDPADIIRIIINLQSGYDLVCGWRQARKDNFLMRTIPSMIANAIISYVTKVKIHDLGCSLKGFKRKIIDSISLYSEMHRFIPIVAVSIGARIAEIPVTHKPRVKGETKYGLSRSWKVLLDLIKVKVLVDFSSKSATLFGFFSIPFWFLGMIFIGKYFYDYLYSQAFYPYSIVIQGTGILHIFLAFSLVSFGYLTELLINTSDYRPNKIIGEITWLIDR